VRALFRLVVVTLGIAALVRWLRHRGESGSAVEAPETPGTLEDPAEELRRKLAESRVMQEDTDSEPPPESSVGERRADVHAQGRAVLAEMTPPDEG
jgi:hypothetical protein